MITTDAFIKAAIWYGSADEAQGMLASDPGIAERDIHTAAITGSEDRVNMLLAEDPSLVTATAGPYGGTALAYLCMSKFIPLHPEREDAFLRIAQLLIDAGADPNAAFRGPEPYPDDETPLYGAAGVLHHAGLTRLLLNAGADPNDNETCYHAPETYENDAMKALVETGKLTTDNLTMMLVRKHDFHDYEGAKYLLENGADPDVMRANGWYPLHHALKRGNRLEMIKLLLDHDANPAIENDGITAVARAAREGRADVLNLFAERGIDVALDGPDALVAAAALDQPVSATPALLAMGGNLVGKFAANGNTAGVRRLLDLGVPVDAPFTDGDAYFSIPANSLPIHVAAWRGHSPVVQLLIDRGSPVNVANANGHTPLMLAVAACVHSYWMWRRTPDSVRALLEAGASTKGIPWPTGYEEIDVLLKSR